MYKRNSIIMFLPKLKVTCIVFALFLCFAYCENKYSKSLNVPQEEKEIIFKNLQSPFRMNKLNLLWTKAQQRLTESKLKSLFSDLKIHDKEEVAFKRFKIEGGDKEGLKEADLRRKLTNIMNNYGLREHFEDVSKREKHEKAQYEASDAHINKSLFKDKKLNMLWQKAEVSGFTSEELAALKEEFTHHQEKIDQYYDLLDKVENGVDVDGYKNAVNEEELIQFNEIKPQAEDEAGLSQDFIGKANLIRDKHRDLRDGFDRLMRVAARGPDNKEFIEPKVQGLWRLAVNGNFTVDELESLKVELQHYENRLLKLRTLQADHISNLNKHHSKVAGAGDKHELFAEQKEQIKKHSRKVEKMHEHLENRILRKHTEL